MVQVPAAMDEPVLLVLIDHREDGELGVRSPGVGWWSDHPGPGEVLEAGVRIGTLARLTRRFALVLAEGASGIVVGVLPEDRAVAVEYGQLLLRLAPLRPGGRDTHAPPGGTPGAGAPAGLAAGTWAVVSPTDGVFYRRPAPDARPFVEPGTRIRAGQPLGLVEVMKTFNVIPYGGPGLPEEAEVVEVRCGDVEEVRAGQILLVVR